MLKAVDSRLEGATLKAGQMLRRECAALTQEAFNEFGALLGTDAPIHVDPAYARATSFGGTIAQGMLLVAPLESWLCELFGEAAWFTGGRLHVRLLNPARAGEQVTMALEVTARDATRVSALEFTLLCADRKLAVGKVSFSG